MVKKILHVTKTVLGLPVKLGKAITGHVVSVIKAVFRDHPYSATLTLMVALSILAINLSQGPKVIRMPDAIMDSEEVDHVVSQIDSLKPGEKATFLVDSFGGNVFFGGKILTALRDTKGDVTCEVKTGAYSMAALTVATCKKIKMHHYTRILFHVGRVYGPTGEAYFLKDDPLMQSFNEILFIATSDILTEEEKIRMFVFNLDIVLTGAEFQSRMCLARKVGCSIVN